MSTEPHRPPPIASWIHRELPRASFWVSDSDEPDEPVPPVPAAMPRRRINVTAVAVVVIAIVVVSFAWYRIARDAECARWRADNVERAASLNPYARVDAAAERELDPYGCR